MGMSSATSYPSLKQCYIYTRNACCTNLHDEAIASALEGLVSSNCADNYDDLIQYFCFGCNNMQGLYVNETAKTITICPNFAARVWTGGNSDTALLSKSQNTFDDCGLMINEEIKIQSLNYKNASEFFKDVKPPFFEGYTVVISDKGNCYDAAISTLSAGLLLLIAPFLSLLL